MGPVLLTSVLSMVFWATLLSPCLLQPGRRKTRKQSCSIQGVTRYKLFLLKVTRATVPKYNTLSTALRFQCKQLPVWPGPPKTQVIKQNEAVKPRYLLLPSHLTHCLYLLSGPGLTISQSFFMLKEYGLSYLSFPPITTALLNRAWDVPRDTAYSPCWHLIKKI